MNNFEKVRVFTNTIKFKDDVSHIEYYEDGHIMLILKDGDKIIGSKNDIENYETLVKLKIWKELKPHKIWASAEAHISRED